jgi:release factor glutamine methyltransferase
MPTVRAALNQARAAGVARLDAQLLLGHLLGRPREWLLAHDETALPDAAAAAWPAWLARRAGGEPLAYIVGEREFCGLRLKVTPAVLVPRPETELLVSWALELLPSAPSADVVDLGTGSGAIALALKSARPALRITASDASAQALAVACDNADRLGLDLECLQGDWWAPLAGRRFGLALANPPYIAGADPHLAALGHEPRSALTPEGDGLAALRTLVEGAPGHLLPGAWLLLEHGHDQGDAVRRLLSCRGFERAQTRADLADLPRCSGAVWPGAK